MGVATQLLRAVSDNEAAAIKAVGGAVASTGGAIQNATRVFTGDAWPTMKAFFDATAAVSLKYQKPMSR